VDLTGMLLRAGATRPRVLAASMPGATAVRLAAEEQLRRRGWPAGMTPADADILLICGDPGDLIAEAVEATWKAVPAPRARAQTAHPGEVAGALDAARVRLADRVSQQALAAAGASRAPLHRGGGAGGQVGQEPGGGGHHGEMGNGEHGAMAGHHGETERGEHGAIAGMDLDMDGMDAATTGMAGMGMAGMGMGGMGMGGMRMGMDVGPVRGLPMAHEGDDRDGLRLDRLHVPLGPVLPDWPAGLVVRLTLQGDVVQEAEPEVLGGGGGSFWDEPWRRAAAGERVATAEAARYRAAAHLDSLGRLLSVAGWGAAATAARRLRDDILAGDAPGRLRPDARRFARRVGRTRTLAWLTTGLGVLSIAEAAAAGAGGRAAGDVTARYRRWCDDLDVAVAVLEDASPFRPASLEPPRGPAGDAGPASAGMLAVLPGLLAGAELAAARLIVASLDPDLDEIPARAGASRDL
jgi:hypothetical protein